MFSIFRDPELRAQFARDGYVTLPFLEEAALIELRKLFEEIKSKVTLEGFATTTTSPDLELKQRIFAQVEPHYASKVNSLFQDFKNLGVSFLQKDPGQSGSLPLHQDWTVTDEDHFRTLTIWIPLENNNIENGAIQVLPGSHRWLNLLRGPNLPIAIKDIATELAEGLVTIPLKAGEAIIFDHSILHTSTLNTSGRPRVALTYGLTHKDTPLRFWYAHPGDAADRFEQLAVPDDFFLQYHEIGKRPSMGKSLGFYRHDLSRLRSADATDLKAGKPIRRPIYRNLSKKTCLLNAPEYPITRNPAWNKELAEKGFALIPLLDAANVAQLKAFFEANQAAKVERFYASVHNPDVDFRLRMDAEIQRVLSPLLAELMDEAEALGGSFIAKPKGNSGILPPHADWNIVDERIWRSYNLWIPLVDTTVANGAVHVIPGSHNWLDFYRGPGIGNPFEGVKNEIWSAMQALEMQAGTALLYDHRLLHASPVNTTETLRLACVTGIKPKAAEMRYYHGKDGLVNEYAANPAFFMTENPENGPADLPFLGAVSGQFPRISGEDLRWFLGLPEANVQEAVLDAPAKGFWETYTPGNIWRELKWRVLGKG